MSRSNGLARDQQLALDRVVVQRDLALHAFLDGRRDRAGLQCEIGVRLAVQLLDLHAGAASDADHRAVLAQAMHEERRDADVAGMCRRAKEQRAPEPASARVVGDGQPEFGRAAERRVVRILGERREVSGRRQRESFVEDAV